MPICYNGHMAHNPHKLLALRLDSLPNGYPPTEDGAELRLLEKLFTPEEALLASQLRLTKETPEQLAQRLAELGWENVDPLALQTQLKGMVRKGLIAAGRTEEGLGFGLMPFVVGIYEAQAGRVDAELARLFEAYYRQAFGKTLTMQPAFHRVVPVQENVRMDMQVQPYESATAIVNNAQAWGVLDCICRVQKALIGDPCEHPVDVCMVLHQRPGVFDGHPVIRALTHDEALQTLKRASQAGLVHSVSNSREGAAYICNCCTCSCGILRGMADLGIANVIARSSFVNQVVEERCVGCEDCLPGCQFDALAMSDGVVQVSAMRCVGCGACIVLCAEEALKLVRRPEDEILPIPATEAEWRQQRADARHIDIGQVL